jgi:WD40 repeat protein
MVAVWCLWELLPVAPRATLTGTKSFLGFSPDGKVLASRGGEGTVTLWNVARGTEGAILRGHEAPVHAAVFSPDGTMLATGGQDGLVKLWDTTAGQELATLHGHTEQVCYINFSPDGKTLATGEQKKSILKLWDTAT